MAITDAASAQAALPTLQAADADLTGVVDEASQLPEDQQQELAKMASSSLTDVQALISQASSIPGVSEVIGSTMGSITGKLTSLLESSRPREDPTGGTCFSAAGSRTRLFLDPPVRALSCGGRAA